MSHAPRVVILQARCPRQLAEHRGRSSPRLFRTRRACILLGPALPTPVPAAAAARAVPPTAPGLKACHPCGRWCAACSAQGLSGLYEEMSGRGESAVRRTAAAIAAIGSSGRQRLRRPGGHLRFHAVVVAEVACEKLRQRERERERERETDRETERQRDRETERESPARSCVGARGESGEGDTIPSRPAHSSSGSIGSETDSEP